MLIKCYNSMKDGRARFSLHSAFDDPTSRRNPKPRESIETRTFLSSTRGLQMRGVLSPSHRVSYGMRPTRAPLARNSGRDADREKPVERRLAAILAADVVGYSRLMGADEVGTLRALKACRKELIDPEISARGGRIVKTTGDGMLVEFASAVEAVACAITMQRGNTTRDEPVPEGKRLTFRIGINVGDIIIDSSDIFGDGVNVAARVGDTV